MDERLVKGQTLKKMENILSDELIGKQLWGDIQFSLDEYEILRTRIKEILEGRDISVVDMALYYPVAVTTFLVFMVRYKYNINFWRLLSEELSTHITAPMESELGRIVRGTFQKKGFDFSDVQNERRVTLEPILYEAGLPPESSLDDLFYILKYDLHNVFEPQLIIDDLVAMRSYQIRKPMLKFLKRFKGDRAVEFVTEVHEAMLCEDQGMPCDSSYVSRYSDWKCREKTKENITARKQQEYQAKPYLAFENGKKGLCITLPRILLKDEWIEEARWEIKTGSKTISRVLSAFEEDGRRYVDTIMIPVSPSPDYRIELVDNENHEDSPIGSWTIEGIRQDSFVVFNASGRVITPNYLPVPYGILVAGSMVSVTTRNVLLLHQSYPTDLLIYNIVSFEPTSKDAMLAINGSVRKVVLTMKLQAELSFSGKTLFGLENDSTYQLFTEVPELVVRIDDEVTSAGLALRIGPEVISIGDSFQDGVATVYLKRYSESVFKQYGTYSIRLYKNDHFIKQTEFTLVPAISTDYVPFFTWHDVTDYSHRHRFRFQKVPCVQLEFDGCQVSQTEDNYEVECPLGVGAISVKLILSSGESFFTTSFSLPIRPLEWEITDQTGNAREDSTSKTIRLGLTDIKENEYWVGLRFFGSFKKGRYRLRLRTVNGIEQDEPVLLAYNGCGNQNLSVFYDTLLASPLPARLELWMDEDESEPYPLMIVSDTVQLSRRPGYTQNGYISLNLQDDGLDLCITSFRDPSLSIFLPYSESVVGKNGKLRGYKCQPELEEGFFLVEKGEKTNAFIFEDTTPIWIRNDNNTLYVSKRGKGVPIVCFSDWLDQLMKDTLAAGVQNDITESLSWKLLDTLPQYKDEGLELLDYERLIALAYFLNSTCSRQKKASLMKCMETISFEILSPYSRLQMLKVLSEMQCPVEVFDSCLQNYHLFLFTMGVEESINLACLIEKYSPEVSMMLRMGMEDTIRNTLMREKYREIIGKEAIRKFLSVPGALSEGEVSEQQRLFLREQPSKVRISLSPDISGEMEPITSSMIRVTYNKVIFDKAAKPEIGVYFDHIKFVDQYVNWYMSHTDAKLNIKSATREDILSTVQEYHKAILLGIDELKKSPLFGKMTDNYESSLKARFPADFYADMKSAKPARFFYLQGLAALLVKMPKWCQVNEDASRAAERFMVKALSIAPRISRRDILMASTHIYLFRKEETICR